ncbi:DUF5988 family protein [Mangrovihabitans endophyticus]|uniref:Uncharacterized protein n=1 Tax=Mangrovihabitans endophyticus TaxID=1751298 RepID=A0A8J3C5X2_9ACTN|nr:DUF5988 family protein [Mangrovihabitans endophyticus]GGL19573.1 hypothetical protein GCM10012284_62670 [Mangrovihabitans endophyticus]
MSSPAGPSRLRPDTDAVLRGGPDDLPAELRTFRTDRDAGTVKVPFYGGYEHFERRAAEPGAGPADGPVEFHWIGRTRVAE